MKTGPPGVAVPVVLLHDVGGAEGILAAAGRPCRGQAGPRPSRFHRDALSNAAMKPPVLLSKDICCVCYAVVSSDGYTVRCGMIG